MSELESQTTYRRKYIVILLACIALVVFAIFFVYTNWTKCVPNDFTNEELSLLNVTIDEVTQFCKTIDRETCALKTYQVSSEDPAETDSLFLRDVCIWEGWGAEETPNFSFPTIDFVTTK